jgi:oligoribonuclease NrnB/cAMP/cGMP phosphodiesterase (DHH superfamily)
MASLSYLAKADAVIVSTAIAGKAVDPSAVDLVIYHADCTDGFGAAFAAWTKLGKKATFLPLQHGPGLVVPDVTGKSVVVLDFCFSKEVTERLISQATAFLVIDHHASAQSALADVDERNKVFEMRQSGSTLAWNFFHGEDVPLFLRYVEDRDIWRWVHRSSEEFSAGFGFVDKTFEAWQRVLQGGDAAVDELIEKGTAIVAYQRKVRDSHVKRSRPVRLACAPQHVGLIVNGSTLASDVGNAMCQVSLPGAAGRKVEFGFIWEYDHASASFRVSLRSDSDAVDVSLMAKTFGGGGHKRAAGFSYAGARIADLLLPVEEADVPAAWKPEPEAA